MTTSAGSPTGSQRAAAIVAIVAFPLAFIALTWGVLSNVGGVLVAIVGVAVLATGGWFAASRRGAGRSLGVVGIIAGILGIVAGIVMTDTQPLAIAATIALASIGLAAARYALRRTTRWLKAAELGGPRRGPAKHTVLLMNPWSGGGKVERFGLVEECRNRGIEPIVLTPGDDLLQLAEDAVARGADVLGMAGGDGSQALIATVAVEHHLPHVVIPAGTRNHLALDLGLDRDDVVGALDAYADGVERVVDLATVNGRVFVNNASLGLYAKIVQSAEYRDAKLRTAADMLPDLLGPDAEPLDLRFTGPDGEEHLSAHMILVSNDPYQLDHLGGRGTRPRMDLGVLGIATLSVADAADARRLIALESMGQIRRFPGWVEWSAARFQIEANDPVEVAVDGEALTMDPPLVFETMPSALRVLLPPHAIGLSPAARRVDRNNISELFDVAKGNR